MNIKKITNFIKENYKISIPIILLLVLFIAFIVYYFISGTFLFINNEEVNVFQYFTSEKLSYKAEVSKNRKGVITDIKSVDMDVYYDSTPIYYTDDDNIVVFPNKMSVVAPIMNCSEYVTKLYFLLFNLI